MSAEETEERGRRVAAAWRRRAGALVTAACVVLLVAGGDQVTRVTPVAAQAPSCRFVLGFEDIRNRIGPQVVGDCQEDQRFAPNGDAVQQTTGGLLAWRKADNWTAFTDGATTWIAGPQGLQRRSNATRFPWEGDAVAMQGNRFTPAERVVPPGASLVWVNLDPEDHDAVASDASFESPLIKPGESWTFTFTQPGTYPYVCTLHRGMEGVVTVAAGGGG